MKPVVLWGCRILALLLAATLALAASPTVHASMIRHFIYLPTRVPDKPVWSDLPPPEPIAVRTKDGLKLQGYRWPATTPNHVTLVFFHGNAGNRYTAALMAAPLRRPDVEIIIASYRGYSGNLGAPSEKGLFRDGAAFLARARQSRPRRLYLFGFSLGGGVALHLAATERVDGVVTLGTFTMLDNVAPRIARRFLPDHFDNLAAVRQLHCAYLILHGTADEVVPFAEAEALREVAGPHARLLRIRDAPHHVALAPLAATIWRNIDEMPPPVAAPAPPGERESLPD